MALLIVLYSGVQLAFISVSISSIVIGFGILGVPIVNSFVDSLGLLCSNLPVIGDKQHPD